MITNLGRLAVLPVSEAGVELPDEQLVRAAQVVPDGEPERHVRVLEVAVDVVDDVLLVDGDREDLSLSIHTDDAAGGLVGSSNEDGFGGNPVHVDADAALDVVKVDVAVFGYQVGDAVLGAHLKE